MGYMYCILIRVSVEGRVSIAKKVYLGALCYNKEHQVATLTQEGQKYKSHRTKTKIAKEYNTRYFSYFETPLPRWQHWLKKGRSTAITSLSSRFNSLHHSHVILLEVNRSQSSKVKWNRYKIVVFSNFKSSQIDI